MISFARDISSILRMDKLQSLSIILHTTTFWASVMAIVTVMLFLSTGLLWPAAAVASSLLTTCVQGYLHKLSQEQRLAKEFREGQATNIAHANNVKALQSCECEHASSTTALLHAEDLEVSNTSAPLVVEGAQFSDARNQGSESVFEPLTGASSDRVSISLTRSEHEDWGFAWQVGAYGAKRFVLVNIRTSSPMDLSNVSRQGQGQPAVALGDELVCVGSDSEFHAMQKALACEMSLELTFLKAHAVPPVLITSRAHRQGKRLSNRVAFKLPLFEKLPETGKSAQELHQRGSCAGGADMASAAAISQELLADSCLDMVQTTKNTFVEFRLRMNNNADQFAKSDPTPMLHARPLIFDNDDRTGVEEASQIDGCCASANNEENARLGKKILRSDINDLDDLVEEGSILRDDVAACESSSFDDLVKKQLEVCQHQETLLTIPHYDTMDLREFTKEGIHFHGVANATDQSPSPKLPCMNSAKEASTPRFDSVNFASILAPSNGCLKTSINLSALLIEQSRVEPALCEPALVEIPTTGPSSYNETLAFAYRHSLPDLISSDSHFGVSHSIPQTSLSEFSCFLDIGSSSIHTSHFLSTPFVAPAPTNIFSLTGQQQSVTTFTSSSQNDLSLHNGSALRNETSTVTSKKLSFAECFSVPFADRWPSTDPYIPRHTARKSRISGNTQDNGHSSSKFEKRDFRPQVGEDWYCPMCFDLQFRANLKCRMCGLPREEGVTELRDLDANKFLQGHRVTAHVAERFRNLAPSLQQTVMSGGSLHGARDPTAVLSNRIRRAESLVLASASPLRGSSPLKLGFDRKQTPSVRQSPAGA
mmetsp:Transcript_633/g.1069  ORF Transcript_633/g.1069 Transcript_633/m.1069 type:complete len:823 (-) Transcript_633:181-2649(-)